MAAPPPAPSKEQPPSYQESTNPAGVAPGLNAPSSITSGSTNPDEFLQPVILVLAGQRILAEQPGVSSTSEPPTAFYTLSRAVAELGDYDSTVTLERLDYKVRTSADGTPRIAPPRGKHVYDLSHPPPVTAPRFAYALESRSRQSLGSLGLVRTSLAHVRDHHLRSAWQAVRKDNGIIEFEISRKDQRRLEWRDGYGRVLAVEEEDEHIPLGLDIVGGSGTKVGEHVGMLKLVMMMPLTRRTLDAMVGVWCLRAWQEAMERAYKPQGFRGFKRILKTRTHEFPKNWYY